MNSLKIDFEGGNTQFLPGEIVRGRASWMLDKAPKSAQISLLWHTSGRGTEDVEVLKTESIQSSSPIGEMPFTFQLPDSPYSFTGQLVALEWNIELVTESPDEVLTEIIVIGPKRAVVRLGDSGDGVS